MTPPPDPHTRAAEPAAPTDTQAGPWVFYAFGCQYPAGLIEGRLAYGSMRRLADRLEGAPPGSPDARATVVSLGDLVYVDATAGLFDPYAIGDRYATPYARLEESRDYVRMREAVSGRFFALPDDHEFDEGWEPLAGDAGNRAMLARGRQALHGHLHGASRDLSSRDALAPLSDEPPCWPLDTRTGREGRDHRSVATAQLITRAQRDALAAWLCGQQRGHGGRPKFVLGPALAFPRRSASVYGGPAAALRSDGWDGYPASLAWLLSLLARERIDNVVLVSGDEHLPFVSGAVLAARGQAPVRVFAVHCPPMHAPYPFANARREDFAVRERFRVPPDVPAAASVRCVVAGTRFADVREGFVRIETGRDRSDPSGWRVEVHFVDGWNYEPDESSAHAARRARRDGGPLRLPLARR
jgi:hypothetical protein